MLIVRSVVAILLICAVFFLAIRASGKSEHWIYLLFPFFGAIPAVIAALVIFAPIEAYMDARELSYLKDVAIPVAGALLIFVFMAVVSVITGKTDMIVRQLATAKADFLGSLAVWSALGAAWGLAWRLTAWLALAVGLARTA